MTEYHNNEKLSRNNDLTSRTSTHVQCYCLWCRAVEQKGVAR